MSELTIQEQQEKDFWEKLMKADPQDLKRLEAYLDMEFAQQEAYLDKICDPHTKTIILQRVHGLSAKEMQGVNLNKLQIVKGKEGEQRLDYKKGEKGGGT